MEKSDGGWQRAQRQAGCESAPDDSVTWRDAAEKIPCSSSPKFYKPRSGGATGLKSKLPQDK